jgi:hypothetical protein
MNVMVPVYFILRMNGFLEKCLKPFFINKNKPWVPINYQCEFGFGSRSDIDNSKSGNKIRIRIRNAAVEAANFL